MSARQRKSSVLDCLCVTKSSNVGRMYFDVRRIDRTINDPEKTKKYNNYIAIR